MQLNIRFLCLGLKSARMKSGMIKPSQTTIDVLFQYPSPHSYLHERAVIALSWLSSARSACGLRSYSPRGLVPS
jgi:hypothetical protein